jgi:hypothetical protein
MRNALRLAPADASLRDELGRLSRLAPPPRRQTPQKAVLPVQSPPLPPRRRERLEIVTDPYIAIFDILDDEARNGR